MRRPWLLAAAVLAATANPVSATEWGSIALLRGGSIGNTNNNSNNNRSNSDNNQDGPIPPTVWECLKNTDESTCNAAVDEDGNPCDWCNTAAAVGICMSQEAAEIAEQFEPLFQCDGTTTTTTGAKVEDFPDSLMDCLPHLDDKDCVIAEDEDGNSCDWCTTAFTDGGACVSSDVADMAKQFKPIVMCRTRATTTTIGSSSSMTDEPDDIMACLPNIDETSCDAAVDGEGNPCDWCTTSFSETGACVSSDIADMAKQFEPFVTCGGDSVATLKDEPDDLLACLPNADESSCNAGVDADGNPCDWCDTTFGVGACVSSDIADMAKQFEPFVTCGDSVLMSGTTTTTTTLKEEPDDLLACLPNADESSCNAGVDADGNPCDWCDTTFGVGACVSSDIADMAKQFEPFVTCGGDSDDLIQLKTLPDSLLACLPNVDAESCIANVDDEGNACDWCDTTFGVGACVSNEVVGIAKEFEPFVTCDGTLPATTTASTAVASRAKDTTATEEQEEQAVDPICFLAGYTSGEVACDSAVDAENAPCVWCSFPTENNKGVCLSQDQANYAQNFLSCDYVVTIEEGEEETTEAAEMQ